MEDQPPPELPPLLCHNVWQAFCAHHVDDPDENGHHLYRLERFSADAVRPFERVFVKTDHLDAFLKTVRCTIPVPFVLVTGHSDLCPSDFALARVMTDPGIVRWYAENCAVETFKLSAIPRGLAEPHARHGDQMAVLRANARAGTRPKRRVAALPIERPDHPMAAILDRREVRDHPRVDCAQGPTTFEAYLDHIASSEYCICVRGPSIDCHAVYEALMVRTVPIYIGSSVPAVYRRLPVIVLQPGGIDALLSLLDDLPAAPAPGDPIWSSAAELMQTADALNKWC